MDLRKLSDDISVAPQITPDDLALAAEQGFKTIICNRPDGEDHAQPLAEDMADAAGDAGMGFVHQPIISASLSLDDAQQFAKLIDEMPKPILAYCRSGTRCSTLWALAQAPNGDIDAILDACKQAGYDYSGMRPTLESLAKNS